MSDQNHQKPVVNQIGGSLVVRDHEARRKAGRFVEPMMKVWDKEGNEHMLSQSNARDKLRHDGWLYYNPNGKPPAAEKADGDETDDKLPEASAENVVLDIKMQQLNTCRAALQSLGIQPDGKWGLKRLKAEIEKAGGIVPAIAAEVAPPAPAADAAPDAPSA